MSKKKNFIVRVYREWTESGELSIRAHDEDEAREIAKERLADDDDEISWEGSNVEPGQQDVESIEEE